jgi:hemerythrin-like domain-containing protein
MQDHHRAEEAGVFQTLFDTGDVWLVTAVHTLKQDHGWIEQNWIEIGPQLRAIAQGNHWIDPSEFMHGAEVFLELCYGHTALEETLIPAHHPATKEVAASAQATGTAP